MAGSAAHVTQRTISNSARALFIPLHLKGHHSRALLSSSTAAADDWLRAGHWHCVPLTVNCQFERRKSTVLRVRASVIGCCPCGRWFVGRYSTDRGRGGGAAISSRTHSHSLRCSLHSEIATSRKAEKYFGLGVSSFGKVECFLSFKNWSKKWRLGTVISSSGSLPLFLSSSSLICNRHQKSVPN